MIKYIGLLVGISILASCASTTDAPKITVKYMPTFANTTFVFRQQRQCKQSRKTVTWERYVKIARRDKDNSIKLDRQHIDIIDLTYADNVLMVVFYLPAGTPDAEMQIYVDLNGDRIVDKTFVGIQALKAEYPSLCSMAASAIS